MASKKNKKEKKVVKKEISEKKEEKIEVVEVKKTETPSKRRNIFVYVKVIQRSKVLVMDLEDLILDILVQEVFH